MLWEITLPYLIVGMRCNCQILRVRIECCISFLNFFFFFVCVQSFDSMFRRNYNCHVLHLLVQLEFCTSPFFFWSFSSSLILQGSCNNKVLPYLEEELLRIYVKEKACRENLWRNGIVKSSPMSPRIHPEYVGTEEVHAMLSILYWNWSCEFLCLWY